MSWFDEKNNPDRNPSPHEIDEAQRAADQRESVENVFARPEDGLDAVDAPFGVEPIEDVEKRTPEVVDELDHAGLTDDLPADHPGDAVEEQSKGVQARWDKAQP